MKIRIMCSVHNDCAVISAEEELHWIPKKEDNSYQLDEGNLYCTGGDDFNHRFYVLMSSEAEQRDWWQYVPLVTRKEEDGLRI